MPSSESSPGARGRPPSGAGHYLRDLVYGATDGVVTTLAVVAGATAAGFGGAVAVVLGIANLAADGFSMGASNYLGLKSELQQTGASVADEMPARHGLATFASFVVAGSAPLLAFAVPGLGARPTFALSAALSALALLGVGAARSSFTGEPRWRAGLEVLAIGGAAAGAAYAVGALVAPLLH